MNLQLLHPETYSNSYHEAGHALVTLLLNRKFSKITLALEEAWIHFNNDDLSRGSKSEQENARDIIKISAAGHAANEILSDKILPFDWTTGDFKIVKDQMRSHNISLAEFQSLYDETKMMLLKKWSKVATVAEGLRNKNVLLYGTVLRIVNE